jgi:hypothetical protein
VIDADIKLNLTRSIESLKPVMRNSSEIATILAQAKKRSTQQKKTLLPLGN